MIDEKKGNFTLTQAPTQEPLNYDDVHYDTNSGSVKYESDLAPYKPKTDIIINATAFTPYNKPMPFFNVAIQVGSLSKVLRIYGPRNWQYTLLGWTLCHPKPITSLDIRYEYSSGGHYTIEGQVFTSKYNPSGMGWYPIEYLKQCNKTLLPAPQIESINMPIENILYLTIPEGFGFFGRSWHQRIKFSGTYDQEWVNKRHPYLPGDFNFNYWNGAHPSLQMPHPTPGDEIPVTLQGLLPSSDRADQKVIFYIPVETLFIFFSSDMNTGITRDMVLDTIIIDMYKRKVFCTYRITLPDILKILEIQLRYIAIADMQRQKKQAAAMLNDTKKDIFLPLPPSLFNQR